MIRTVLVDDELQSSKSLAIKLKTAAVDFEIVGTYYDPENAIAGIRKLKPAVVFLDIEMPGMNGFQMLEKMGVYDFEVIFVTAYNEYILHALRISALDYLLKPVGMDELKNSLTRLRKKILVTENFEHTKEQVASMSCSLRESQMPKRLALANSDGVIFLKINEIIRVEALSNYSAFHLINKQKVIVSKSLKEFETVLAMHNFFRINRSCIVNTHYILKYKNEEGGILELQDGTKIAVGPHRKNDLVELLSRI